MKKASGGERVDVSMRAFAFIGESYIDVTQVAGIVSIEGRAEVILKSGARALVSEFYEDTVDQFLNAQANLAKGGEAIPGFFAEGNEDG